MRILFIAGLLAFFGHTVTAQIIFEKGYFVRNDGTRMECLIKNVEWKNNPKEFQYKTESTDAFTLSVLEVAEFGVYDQWKYKTLTVNIDRSVFKINEQSTKNPTFQKETLALRVLLEGTADLYYYEDANVIRFFFGVNDRVIEQLVYKEYQVESGDIAKNETFKQQLWLNVKCGGVTEEQIKRLRYRKEDLLEYFNRFNQCSGDEPKQAQKKKPRNVFIKLSSGAGFSTLDIKNYHYRPWYDKKFENEITYHLGLEAEFVLPFNRNKWSVVLEPSYNTFKGETGDEAWGNEAERNTIEFGIGARHYFYLNANARIFLSGLVVFYVPLKESVTYMNLQTMSNVGGAVGAGYGYKRLSTEVRHYFKHEALANYVSWSGKQSKSIIVLTYRIF